LGWGGGFLAAEFHGLGDAEGEKDGTHEPVERTRCALAEHGLQVAVHGWPAHRKEPRGKLDGWAEAHLVVASCSPPPQGAARWTLKLLGDHLVRLNLVESISGQTVGRALKKTS
jgi:hypothetical protein